MYRGLTADRRTSFRHAFGTGWALTEYTIVEWGWVISRSVHANDELVHVGIEVVHTVCELFYAGEMSG